MHQFTVIDARADGHLLALRDEGKRCHVVRVGLPSPQVESVLRGLPASPGHAMLLTSEGGIFRVNFEHVDLSQADTLAMLHPTQEANAARGAVPGSHVHLAAANPNSRVIL